MSSAVLVSEEIGQLGIGGQGHVLGFVDRVKVGNQGNRDPVMPSDAIVAADDRAQLSRVATAQDQWRLRTNPRQVDCGVTSPAKGSVVAVRLFQQKRNAGIRL